MRIREQGYQINKDWLDANKVLIQKNAKTITGVDLHDLYMDFFKLLKYYRGTSAGYTGLSEFFVHNLMLGLYGDFEVKPKKGSTGMAFVDKNTGLKLESSPPIPIEGGTYSPDHAIFLNKKLLGVVGVKIYQVDYENILKEVNKMRALGKPALLIFYQPPTKKPRDKDKDVRKLLKNFKQEMSVKGLWFDSIILKEYSDELAPVFQNFLDIVKRGEGRQASSTRARGYPIRI